MFHYVYVKLNGFMSQTNSVAKRRRSIDILIKYTPLYPMFTKYILFPFDNIIN